MNKLYLFLILAFSCSLGNAQIVTIPDANFKSKLISLGVDTNFDGNIQQSEALAKTNLNLDSAEIHDLTGISAFSNLIYLHFSSNHVSDLSVINGLSHVISVICNHNEIASLSGLNNLPALSQLEVGENPIASLAGIGNIPSLEYFSCDNCSNLHSLTEVTAHPNLKSLNCSRNPQITLSTLAGASNLTALYCTGMGLTSLDAISSLTNLIQLNVYFNSLSTIDLSHFPNLTILDCSSNNLSSLNLASVPNLQSLLCVGNHINSLDLSQVPNLSGLFCDDNNIASLNVSLTPNLTGLSCSYNFIDNLDLSGLSELSFLDCSFNHLTTLDVSNQHSLSRIYCSDMESLTTIFMKNGSNNYELVNPYNFQNCTNLNYICADDFYVPLIQDYVSDIAPDCHVNSYCSFSPGGVFYTIRGNNRFDSNNNGCEVTDINYPNLKLSFSNGSQSSTFFANTTGNYHYDVEAGNHSISATLENPSYFTISPTSATVSFPSTTSPFLQDFCIVPNGNHNDLEVVLFPLTPARPGFDATYRLFYKNKGTTIQSGTVSLDFDDTIMDLTSSIPANTSQAANTLNWSFSNLAPFETREIEVTFNLNSPVETPPTNAGNLIIYTATVTGLTDETPADNTAILTQEAVNSFDPNDKTCIEGKVLPVNEVGKYVHYIIRFENNGSANAENIVVKDIIDTTKFDLNTLVPLSGSASFQTKISNANRVEFIFENINLPFDDTHNDGFVAFKIKTKSTLAEGDTFSNSADIFFDYNAPVVTLPYTTLVFNPLATADFNFSHAFSLSPVPAKNILTITNKQNVLISSISIYNMLGQLIQVNTDPAETIDVSGLKSGSYFIKIISDRGTAGSQFIKE